MVTDGGGFYVRLSSSLWQRIVRLLESQVTKSFACRLCREYIIKV